MKTIGITIGDPNGIGPEIAVKTVSYKRLQKKCRMVLIGEWSVLEQTRRKLRLKQTFVPWNEYKGKGIAVLDCPQPKPTRIEWGKISGPSGMASLSYVALGGMLAMQRKIDALVTCPISKEAVLIDGPSDFAGHTDYLADLTNASEYALSLWHGNFRVVHVSCHVSLRQAIELCEKKRIVGTAKLLHAAMRAAGIRRPKIGVAGLNPHAGEAGAFGQEDLREIKPAVQALCRLGIEAEGPIPPDIVFARMKGGRYDGVVAMYHDQGHIATKTLFFSLGKNGKASVGGVNATLGLPIVRTSVDHGTSFDIAGKGIADPTSLIDAVELAVRFAAHR